MKCIPWLSVAICVVGLASCGFPRPADIVGDAGGGPGDDGGGGRGGDDAAGGGLGGSSFSLSATPMQVDVPIAGSATVTVGVVRTGDVGDVTLSAPDLPAGLSVSFATISVPAGVDSTEVTISVTAGTPSGVLNVTIAGAGSGQQAVTTIAVNVKTITVNGMIRGGLSGVTVRVIGKPAVISGANGSFTFTDVSPPYDIYTLGTTGLNSTSFKPTAYYFVGITRPDPVVSAPQIDTAAGIPPTNGTTVSGTATGGDAKNPLTVVWDGGGSTSTTTGAYSLAAQWSPATETTTGTLYGFQFSTKPNGAPDVFSGYGASALVGLTGTRGQTGPIPARVDLNLARPQSAQLTGTITPPSGFLAPFLQIDLQVGAKGTVLELWPLTQTATVDATIPVVGAGKVSLSGLALTSGNTANIYFEVPGLAASADVSMILPAPPVAVAPLGAVTGVTSATGFTWTSVPDAIYQIDVNSSGTTARYVIQTTATSMTLPVVPELPLPKNVTFSWSLQTFSPYVGMNDSVSGRGIATTFGKMLFDGPTYMIASSQGGNFVTAP